MIILPAIDLKDGKCVRLRQGRAEDVTVYGDNGWNRCSGLFKGKTMFWIDEGNLYSSDGEETRMIESPGTGLSGIQVRYDCVIVKNGQALLISFDGKNFTEVK